MVPVQWKTRPFRVAGPFGRKPPVVPTGSGSWMRTLIDIDQSFPGHVGVDLCRGQPTMAEQLLNTAQVRALLQQMRREAMSQNVWTDATCPARHAPVSVEQPCDAPDSQSRPESIEEDRRLARTARLPRCQP